MLPFLVKLSIRRWLPADENLILKQYCFLICIFDDQNLKSTLLILFIQINGVEVRSREDAIQLFSQNRAGITLLIARALYQVGSHAFMSIPFFFGLN